NMFLTCRRLITILLLIAATVAVQLLVLLQVEPTDTRADPTTRGATAAAAPGDWQMQRRLEQIDQMVAAALAPTPDPTAGSTSFTVRKPVNLAQLVVGDQPSPGGDPEEQFLADRWMYNRPLDPARATPRLRLFTSTFKPGAWSDDLLVAAPAWPGPAPAVPTVTKMSVPSSARSARIITSAPWRFDFLITISTDAPFAFPSFQDKWTPPDVAGVEVPF
ncbi:MAG: hypothetical protein OER86_12440, partial [Phycisphaerae bacterium]|nr:hypothetical protein [Phycisphaerae bacterium]